MLIKRNLVREWTVIRIGKFEVFHFPPRQIEKGITNKPKLSIQAKPSIVKYYSYSFYILFGHKQIQNEIIGTSVQNNLKIGD